MSVSTSTVQLVDDLLPDDVRQPLGAFSHLTHPAFWSILFFLFLAPVAAGNGNVAAQKELCCAHPTPQGGLGLISCRALKHPIRLPHPLLFFFLFLFLSQGGGGRKCRRCARDGGRGWRDPAAEPGHEEAETRCRQALELTEKF